MPKYKSIEKRKFKSKASIVERQRKIAQLLKAYPKVPNYMAEMFIEEIKKSTDDLHATHRQRVELLKL